MKRLVSFVLSLCLVLTVAFAATNAIAADQKPFVVHFVVLSKTLADGSDSGAAILMFEEEVIKLAGGFTDLGVTRGGSLHDDGVHHQDNRSFIIGADKDISIELKAMTKRFFGGDGAFILSWPGKVLF